MSTSEDIEKQPLTAPTGLHSSSKPSGSDDGRLTSTGLKVLALLAFQNCSKNLLTRFVMARSNDNFLLSAAVIGSELTKLTLSTLYILLIDRRPLSSIVTFLKEDWWNSLLLVVPATTYNAQQTLEYVALANIDASVFSVLVQSKLIMTALFAVGLLGKKLRKSQVLSLCLLTVGVILCNMKKSGGDILEEGNQFVGICATLGIALASGFASVYTEKVMKKKRSKAMSDYSLAYMQVQLASVSLVIMGAFAVIKDFNAILEDGLWQNFDGFAFVAVINSGIGGLMVAAVLKFADSVLKGYATAVSVILSGVLSMLLFGTSLDMIYGLGIINVIAAVVLYNASDLDAQLC